MLDGDDAGEHRPELAAGFRGSVHYGPWDAAVRHAAASPDPAAVATVARTWALRDVLLAYRAYLRTEAVADRRMAELGWTMLQAQASKQLPPLPPLPAWLSD
jgi:hypothetical protein